MSDPYRIISGTPAKVKAVAPPGKAPGGAGGTGDHTYFATGTIDVAAWLMVSGFPLEMAQRIAKSEGQFNTDFMFVYSDTLMRAVKDFYDGRSKEAKFITGYVLVQIRLRRESRERTGVMEGPPADGEFVCNKFDVAAWLLLKGVKYLGMRSRSNGGRQNWDYIFRAGEPPSALSRDFFIPKDKEASAVRTFTDSQADLRRIKRTMEKRYGD